MADVILSLNAGSSSLKFGLFIVDAPRGVPSPVLRGAVEKTVDGLAFRSRDEAGSLRQAGMKIGSLTLRDDDFYAQLIEWVEARGGGGHIAAVGHRVVHGGLEFAAPVRLDAVVLAKLDELGPLAPLHQADNLLPARALAKVRPTLPQVVCFDTAFHRFRAPVTTRFALPREYEAAGIQRYGFHGLSYEYVVQALAAAAPELSRARLIIAHLGNGASLCAVRDGRSVDTTMSFTTLDGLPMGTRCGSLDPGVVLYLLREKRMNVSEVEDLLYRRSGLLGVSGLSGDMRTLLASDAPMAVEAIELFAFRITREIGALTATLGGLDAIIFTAGIGEHSPEIRRRVALQCAWLGASLDEAANARVAAVGRISARSSAVALWIIPTDEEIMIARHTLTAIGGSLPDGG